MKKSLKQETMFYGISKYTNVLVTLLISSILSRILTPPEFGIVSVVTVFTAFFTILSDLGLGAAIIQDKTLSESETNDIFSFSVYVALGLAIAFALLGFPISVFYGNVVYVKICCFLSIAVFFNAANVAPNAALMKKKQFGYVGRRLIVVSVVSGAVAVLLAVMGYSYYAIVMQSVLQSVLIYVWNQTKTRLHFRFFFSYQSIRKIQRYSIYQFLYSFINYFARNLDNLLIGKVLGDASLAYYDKGYRLMMYPVQNLTYVINPILHPILSEFQDQKRYIYNSYLRIVRILSLIGVFISVFCFWASEEIILLFFGGQWSESVPLFRMLSLSVWPQLVSTSAGSVYQSTGNTKLMFKSGIIHFSTTIVLIIFGILFGELRSVAALVAISLFLRFFIDYYFLIVKDFRYSYMAFLKTFRVDLVIAVALGLTAILCNSLTVAPRILSLFVKGVILGSVYLLALILTGQMKFLYQFVKKRGKD